MSDASALQAAVLAAVGRTEHGMRPTSSGRLGVATSGSVIVSVLCQHMPSMRLNSVQHSCGTAGPDQQE